jgi:Protein of unknown function (DUF2798).
MRILPACLAAKLVPLFVSCCMTCVVSAIATLRAVDAGAFWDTWPTSWLISWAVAYPIMLVMLPLVRRAVAACTIPE